MSWDRKAERTTKFHKNKQATNKQKSKSYLKEKKERKHDFENSRLLRDSDRSK
jgi:hypothetical protein